MMTPANPATTDMVVPEPRPATAPPLDAPDVGEALTVVATPSGNVYAAQHVSQACVSHGLCVLLVEKRKPASESASHELLRRRRGREKETHR